MTIEPTPDRPATTDPAPAKVTRARAKTSGATSRAAKTPKTPKSPLAIGETDVARPEVVKIIQGGADRVDATNVSVTQGGIGTADAQTIDVRQGGIGRASATDIAVSAGGIGYARGGRVSIEMGAVGAALGDEVRVTQAVSGFVATQGEAIVDQSLVSTLVADRVTMRQPSGVLVLIARQVDGSVRPVLDWRGALAAGAAAGLVMGLLRMGRR